MTFVDIARNEPTHHAETKQQSQVRATTREDNDIAPPWKAAGARTHPSYPLPHAKER